MLSWVIEGQLARGERPGYSGERGRPVAQAEVDSYIQVAKSMGIQSIICLLGEDQLSLYSALPTALVSYYRQHGFHVEHIPATDHQQPPLSQEHLHKVWLAYQELPKALLVHCSAGCDRTGMAVKYIMKHME